MTIPQGARFNITIRQGGTYRRTFRVMEADGTTPRSLAGYVGKAQVRTSPGGALLAEFDVDVHDTADIEDDDCGMVDIVLDAETTALITASGAWDLALTNESTDVAYMVQGTARLDRRVTVIEDDEP